MRRGPLILALTTVVLTGGAARAEAENATFAERWAQAISSKPTEVPQTQGRAQPQGDSGPLNTKSSGGAPAESPQGETPPGMQSAPEGSSQTTKEPNR